MKIKKEFGLAKKKQFLTKNPLSLLNFQKYETSNFERDEEIFGYQINRQGFVKFNYELNLKKNFLKTNKMSLNLFFINEIKRINKKQDSLYSLKILPIDFSFVFKTIKNILFFSSNKTNQDFKRGEKKLNSSFLQFYSNYSSIDSTFKDPINLTKKKLFDLQKDSYLSVTTKFNEAKFLFPSSTLNHKNSILKKSPFKKIFFNSFEFSKRAKKNYILNLSRLLYFVNFKSSEKCLTLKSFSETISYIWVLENKLNSSSKNATYQTNSNSIFNFCVLSWIKSQNKKIWKVAPKFKKNKSLKNWFKERVLPTKFSTEKFLGSKEAFIDPLNSKKTYKSSRIISELLKSSLGWLGLKNILSNFIKFELRKKKYVSLSLKSTLITNKKEKFKNSKSYQLLLNEIQLSSISKTKDQEWELLLKPRTLLLKKKVYVQKTILFRSLKKAI